MRTTKDNYTKQGIGRLLVFNILTLANDGLYILYELTDIKIPLTMDDLLKFGLDFNKLVSVLKIYGKWCVEKEPPITNSRKRLSMDDDDFDKLIEKTLDNRTPQDICENPDNLLPALEEIPNSIDTLRLKVARLIDDPNIVILDDNISLLLSDACTRILTLKENEKLRMESLSNYPLTEYVAPSQINRLIDLNQFLALDIVPYLLRSDKSQLYLEALLNSKITTHSLEVVHHILVNNVQLSPEFIHYYISNSIRSCEELEDGPGKSRQVKQVTRFIQSLLEKKIIPMKDYFVEIQSFCIPFMKLKGVANLFRLASQEAQQQRINF
ncbi:hypothetical protein MFLAVUS_003911 [Mucor flavus]|uniref:CCR4-NOT transcription complex subunit 11 n=1 Tax=Mucor flavus TaxID=439312 RepID=A0ABP9YUF9_9FUNG